MIQDPVKHSRQQKTPGPPYSLRRGSRLSVSAPFPENRPEATLHAPAVYMGNDPGVRVRSKGGRQLLASTPGAEVPRDSSPWALSTTLQRHPVLITQREEEGSVGYPASSPVSKRVLLISLYIRCNETGTCSPHPAFMAAFWSAAVENQNVVMQNGAYLHGVPDHAKVTMSSLRCEFAVSLFQQLRKSEEGNISFSSLSIASALAMFCLGAQEKTSSEIQEALYLKENERAKVGNLEYVHHRFQKFLTKISQTTDAYTLKIANKLYGDKKFQFHQEFLENLKKFYQGSLEPADFTNAAEESQKAINSWMGSQMHGKTILPKGSLKNTTLLVLVDTAYFTGEWDKKFDGKMTEQSEFWLTKDKSKPVQMMKQTNSFDFCSLEDLQMKILEIPYKDKELSLVLLLPNEVDGLKKLEDKLTPEKLMEWTSLQNMSQRRVTVHLPRLQMEGFYDLKTALMALGVVSAFSAHSANLARMTGGEGLVLSNVLHQCCLEVAEGKETAAASRAEEGTTAAPAPESFRCDHPFLFFIKHIELDSVFFFGRVSSP
ncbi:PREDICTED: serpin B3 [Condylura cristata]|uniref:serpin B3 n=1 Tax=Condylura cristata TaxID=143302 RepID=UPI00064333BA|nr:PREDICTED: serpin B3 [Condylura cristata]